MHKYEQNSHTCGVRTTLVSGASVAAEKYRPIHDRLLHIDRLICEGSARSARTLAEAHEVSIRTIKRDIEYMRDSLNAPIEYEPSGRGYYYSDPHYRLQNITLTSGDIFAVYLAEKVLEQYDNTPLFDELSRIFDRLRALVPSSKITVPLSNARDRFSMIHEPRTRIDFTVWTVVFDALRDERVISFDYTVPRKPQSVSRTVHPYHSIAYRGEWYLIGFSVRDGALRTYALSRMENAQELDESFDYPPEFSTQEYLGTNFGIFSATNSFEVSIRFSAEQASYVRERVWQRGQTIDEQPDGKIVLRFAIGHLYETSRWVLSWGGDAEVLGPEELRTAVKEELRRAAKQYRKAKGGASEGE